MKTFKEKELPRVAIYLTGKEWEEQLENHKEFLRVVDPEGELKAIKIEGKISHPHHQEIIKAERERCMNIVLQFQGEIESDLKDSDFKGGALATCLELKKRMKLK